MGSRVRQDYVPTPPFGSTATSHRCTGVQRRRHKDDLSWGRSGGRKMKKARQKAQQQFFNGQLLLVQLSPPPATPLWFKCKQTQHQLTTKCQQKSQNEN